ncbi:MAG: hypothetical protein ACP5IE_01980 [Infirmifilum sp.]
MRKSSRLLHRGEEVHVVIEARMRGKTVMGTRFEDWTTVVR